MPAAYLILGLLIYLASARGVMLLLRGTTRDFAFTLVNLVGYIAFLAAPWNDARYFWAFALYVLIALALYACMALFSHAKNRAWLLAFGSPIIVLAFFRYTPPAFYSHLGASFHAMVEQQPHFTLAVFFIGISYLAFRCSHLVIEVRNGRVEKPGLWAYLGFCFFVPTMSLGPINSYSHYRRGFASDPPLFSTRTALMRIGIGFVKYLFLGNIFAQLSYSGLLLDDHYHPWIDLPIAVVFYYFFLYCNFSGFCDIAIGASALIGIPVLENFQDPFAARNMREFWNRWHITLSNYMREVVFSPLSKWLARLLGPTQVNQAVSLSIVAVFLAIGIWHGTGWNYAVFGLLQALGVVTVHYYTIWLKRSLSRESFKAYNANRWIAAAGTVMTFCYFSATLFFFANSPEDMRRIFEVLK